MAVRGVLRDHPDAVWSEWQGGFRSALEARRFLDRMQGWREVFFTEMVLVGDGSYEGSEWKARWSVFPS